MNTYVVTWNRELDGDSYYKIIGVFPTEESANDAMTKFYLDTINSYNKKEELITKYDEINHFCYVGDDRGNDHNYIMIETFEIGKFYDILD